MAVPMAAEEQSGFRLSHLGKSYRNTKEDTVNPCTIAEAAEYGKAKVPAQGNQGYDLSLDIDSWSEASMHMGPSSSSPLPLGEGQLHSMSRKTLMIYLLPTHLRLEHKEVLVGLVFLVFPASNLFFRVGFVVAERVLYMPSMGYCILFVHGLRKLCTCLNRWGATTLTVCTALLLLVFSWKTVKQNETWLSRESLFRSGVQTLPHNAKVHYNYANFLKDQGRNWEAIYHYRTALR
ncbi:protein O-mannosyl-transferase TMTC1-like [Ursus americanus]|uniref:protein O-mannosyl-transferase TMTC1-like n=1 Tax=Ursus americanus TaxID=9643 RepID=UPI001E67B31B|nr:protein O-mannosyl-transferase TMTC1-like [Ursus americanus]